MKTTLIAMICALPLAALADQNADVCMACHKDALTLTTWQAAPLAARLIEMRDGRASHVVPLPKLSDAELHSLAAALAGK